MRLLIALNIIVLAATFTLSRMGLDHAQETIDTLRDSLKQKPIPVPSPDTVPVVVPPPQVITPHGPDTTQYIRAIQDLSKQNNDLRGMIAQAQQDVANLKDKNNGLQAENAKLRSELAQLQQRYQSLVNSKDPNETLRTENTRLKNELAQLQQRYQSLVNQKDPNESLRTENTRLKSDLAQLQQRYQILQKDYEALKRETAPLLAQVQQLQRESATDKQTILQLQAENAKLRTRSTSTVTVQKIIADFRDFRAALALEYKLQTNAKLWAQADRIWQLLQTL